MIRICITDLAKIYRKPYLSSEGQLKDVWEPIEKSESIDSPLRFLDLNLNPNMIDNPFAQRDKFWRELELDE